MSVPNLATAGFSAAALFTSLSGTAIPEPTSAVLFIGALGAFLSFARHLPCRLSLRERHRVIER
jgi:hypothetical protein